MIFLKIKTSANDKVKWKWGELERKVFEELKVCLTTPPVLPYPDFSRHFIMHSQLYHSGGFPFLAQLLIDILLWFRFKSDRRLH